MSNTILLVAKVQLNATVTWIRISPSFMTTIAYVRIYFGVGVLDAMANGVNVLVGVLKGVFVPLPGVPVDVLLALPTA